MKKLLTAAAAATVTVAVLVFALPAPGLQADEITADELQGQIEEGTAPLILDVRTAQEYLEGHVPGAVNISHDELGDRLSELDVDPGDMVVVYCGSGRRAGIAQELLGEAGFTNLRDLEGHWRAWNAAGRPTESGE